MKIRAVLTMMIGRDHDEDRDWVSYPNQDDTKTWFFEDISVDSKPVKNFLPYYYHYFDKLSVKFSDQDSFPRGQ